MFGWAAPRPARGLERAGRPADAKLSRRWRGAAGWSSRQSGPGSDTAHTTLEMLRTDSHSTADGGLYSSDSAGQTPSLASIYQVGTIDSRYVQETQ